MTNLHYENMLQGDHVSPWILMLLADKQLDPMIRYLKAASAWLKSQALTVDWEDPRDADDLPAPPTPPVMGMNGMARAQPPAWVVLRDPPGEEISTVIPEFLEAEFVDDAPSGPGRRIRVLDANEDRGALLLERRPRAGSHLTIAPNTIPLSRQLNAVYRLQNTPMPHHRPLMRLLERPDLAEWPTFQPEVPDRWVLLGGDDSPGTAEQRAFVSVALSTPDFAVLKGPPGAGKTTAICELIVQEILRGRRVLLCASTHVAVDNVLEKLAEIGVTRNLVIAVRVGDPRKISAAARPFQLDRRVSTELELMKEKLQQVAERVPSQEYLLRSLAEQGKETIARIILECSNLICGTTIGILKHPDLAAWLSAGNGAAVPISPGCFYDTLILDEASKTTFQEFLVPALLARRWIVVGDVHQLSPFVDEPSILGSASGIIPRADAEACAPFAASLNDPLLIASESPEVRARMASQARGLGLYPVLLDQPPEALSPTSQLEVLGASVVIVDSGLLTRWQDRLPHDLLNSTDRTLDLHDRRRDWWVKRSRGRAPLPHEPDVWEKEVSWRLVRTFEHRKHPEHRERYEAELDRLVPRWYAPEEQKRVRHDFRLLRRVAFPSVLELLEEGFPFKESEHTSSLTDGLPPQALGSRRVSLTYQHRMHPDLSRFPREKIYGGEFLRDPEGIADSRAWTYNGFQGRSAWLNVRGPMVRDRNANEREAEWVLRTVRGFAAWARANPPPSSQPTWTVGVLTFYRAQESLLRARLAEDFVHAAPNQFVTRDGRIEIALGTVDRFQGREVDFCVLSFVRNRSKGVGFLDSINRINVAITRARYQRVIIGDHSFFLNQRRSELLRDLAADHVPALTYGGSERR